MRTEKELEKMRLEVVKYMPSMPVYKDYEVADRYGCWFIYTGLLETRYMMGKSFNKETKKYGYY
ncbi:hypothetical protein LCGC14_1135030 [marine sediment metagenome]|uniref:Uncharacterized protein n=1 Tax=marine sediment metagenome TaxID=412755 RepID=A0A0F9Q5L6_9ZZZZ